VKLLKRVAEKLLGEFRNPNRAGKAEKNVQKAVQAGRGKIFGVFKRALSRGLPPNALAKSSCRNSRKI